MPVTNYYLIGSITIPSTWIAFIVASLLAYIAIRMKFGKKHSERFGDSIFYLIIIWKLSVILTDFSTVIHSPISIIYFNGGFIGFCLGLVFMALRLVWGLKRGDIGKEGLVALFTGAVVVQALFQVMMVVLNEGSILAKLVTTIIFLALAIFVWISIGREDRHLVQLSLLFMAGHTFVATVQPKGLLNSSHLVTVAIGLFFMFLFSKKIMVVLEERGNCNE